MKQLKKGMYARSLAGHDVGRLYIIMDADTRYVYLTDGRLRPLEKLKKKKIKHVQVDTCISEILRDRMEQQLPIRDEDIRKAIKVKEV